MNDNDKSLVVADDEQERPEDETLSASMGGYPALILLIVTLISIVVVFGFADDSNPAAVVDEATEEAAEVVAQLPTYDLPQAQAAAATEEPVVEAATEEPIVEVATEEVVVEAATEEMIVETATEEPVVEAATEEMIVEAATEEPVVEVATEEVEVMAAVETEEPVIEAATEEVVVEVATEELVEVAMVATEEAEVNPLDLEGDIAAGEIVFNTTYPQTGFMCASCHTVTEDRERILGPSLYNISEIGLERIAETGDPDVATYVLNSMINPRDYIVPADDEGPYPEAIMPPNWGDVLTAQEQADVLAYVMSLGADEVEVEATEAATEEAADMMEVATEEAVEVVETEAALMQDTATEEAAPVETEEAAEAIETEEAAPVETEEAVEAVETEEAAPVETEEAETESAAAEVDVVAAAIAAGDVELGEQVFNMQYDTAVGPWICASCHSVTEDMLRLVGPGQWGLYERAEERLAESGDPDVVTYVRNSILMPQAYIVPADAGGPYPANLMPPNYGEVLTDEELDAVVAYLLTLGNPDYTE